MKNRIRLFLLLFLLLIRTAGAEGTIRLPEGLLILEEDAFAGDGEIREVYIPANAQISVDAFQDADRAVWIHCPAGEYALSLLAGGYDADAGTVYRAVVVAQTYEGTGNQLEGPANDGQSVKDCLQHLSRTGYEVFLHRNLTADGILEACRSDFANATPYDVSLFYYSGHGLKGGRMLGINATTLPVASLKNVLDTVPGRKIIVMDACYSGTAAGGVFGEAAARAVWKLENGLRAFLNLPEAEEPGNTDPAAAADSFNASVLSAFSSAATRSPALKAAGSGAGFSAYYVMTACAEDEESWEDAIYSGGASRHMGVFTFHLCRGIGWDGVRQTGGPKYADTDGNGVVTFGEAFTYAARQASASYMQHAQSNAAGLQSFSPFR